MKFGRLQKSYFNADAGAYSIVTDRERTDGQITITEADGEADIVLSALGASSIPRGAAAGARQPLSVVQKDGSERAASVTINYPKNDGNELRIYRNAGDGFDFETGDVWFVFQRAGALLVGCMPEPQWRAIGTTDPHDDRFQATVDSTDNSQPKGVIEFAGKRYPRDPAVSRQAILNSGYICEFTGMATPFISKRTGMPYLEAHHLIPLGLQAAFNLNLDCVDNVVALNPLWHRAIHHAEPRMVQQILTDLSQKKESFLKIHNVDQFELIQLYGCEEIV
ncbi:HNH endonuclease [Puniceicoccus vermicola]|uniref:HNH endonuclease n=1 Tax=Puniceicoccus vermicola TaxID=388746 RepID=A0A7X1E622_9BACT|nr:hypothetical protein [Puniceicoccus vermicola]MBC2604235.1 hypothetical protein [Puniceicoccus vermicola]